MGRRRLPLHPLLLAALVKLAVSCIADDEFLCEESTAHLQECCPEMNAAPIDCDRDFKTCSGFQCNPHFTSTEINERAAICLIDKDCDRIRASNICARLSDPTKTSAEEVERVACAP
jgi:hypothetical protein